MSKLMKGTRVHHVDFGEGQVISLGRFDKAKVAFDRRPGLPRTVARGGLELLDAPNVNAQAPAPSLPLELESELERAEAWQSLEAMRLGVVPSTGTFAYTVQRDAELAELRSLLDDGCGLRALWGDYGAGKTHLLDAMEHMALRENFVAARVTVDPREIAAQFPGRVYNAIVGRLRLPDADGDGLAALFERLEQS